ncbi:CMP-N-acetylneuraminate-beta-galactosamide-alpha-2,3-sialyltransferase 1-like [Xyrauchen texanus]|uniref:CMP-N-acetylneuraminate-beta-galactosamide- alpha-2,3-sialyltransferase 1-like n=1 Tax=Xyrauchen texanus TaxID=154827 RepID=UPI00224189FA|nr:CMP-N-acetylneuraminate-beta-galactosamide-alpha-2,3-sialyltransferase 1-like [Xyrauchen texanus]XP_051991515.1 CMP-N-acetylneuraminate-beta-galactosamide-alpha-2,3-sialyltransferase 1-like [Xyrauchen texanus]
MRVTDGACSKLKMSLFWQRKMFTLMALFCAVTFSMFVFSYTLREPSLYLLKSALGLGESTCACHRCITHLHDDDDDEDDGWFMERFNQSFHPLMSRKNSLLTDDTYRWWQWLQAERNPSNLSVVLDRLFQLIPSEENYVDSGPNRCRTCSVVGNSGNLLKSHYGSYIDSSDFVIRMNQASTQGFEKDVGYKTTHHVMYPESAVDLDNNTSLILIPFKTLDLEWMISALTTGNISQTYIPVISHIKANKDKVLIYNPSFFKYVYDSWLEGHGRYPSTGFLSLMFAVHVCDEVNVFGFGADQYGNWHHYWEDNMLGGAFRHTGVHDGDYEYNITLLLADKHKITLYRGV